MKIKTNSLFLAELKYYSKEVNGIEIGDAFSYSFLIQKDNNFINVFDVYENYPVFERVSYSNCTKEGIEYGKKVILKNNIDESGPCYVLLKNGKDIFLDDEILYDDLKKYVLNSDLFFKERIEIMKNNKNELYLN